MNKFYRKKNILNITIQYFISIPKTHSPDSISTKESDKSGKSEKVYLFDTENEGSARILAYLKKHNVTGCNLYLFYTSTNKKDIENIPGNINNNNLYKVLCKTGKNALDFQLIAYTGLLLKDNADSEYIVVTKDTGFASAVDILASNGVKISLDTEDCLVTTKTQTYTPETRPDEDPKIHKAKCIINTYIPKNDTWSAEDKDFIAECAVNSHGGVTKFGALLAERYPKNERQSLYKALTDQGRTELLS